MAELDQYLDRMGGGDDMESHRRNMQALTMLREIFLNLVKHGKTSRLYGVDHHLPRRFLEGFTENTARFLDEFELLLVEVRPDNVMFNEHSVLREDVGEQMAYGLYSEGVRAISVERGCEVREMKALADLLAVDWLSRGEGEEDLMASAWRSDFHHVHIDVVDRFSDDDEMGDALERDDLGTGRASGNDPRKRQGDSILVPEIQALLRELESEGEDREDLVKMKQDEVNVLLQLRDELREGGAEEGGDQELMVQDPASAALLQREIELVNREEDASIARVGEVLFELARLEESDQGLEELGKLTARNAAALLDIAEFEGAARLVHRVMALLDSDLFPDFAGIAALSKGYAAMVEGGLQERVLGAIRRLQDPNTAIGPLFTLLAPLPREAVFPLVRMGASLEGLSEVRQVFADTVVVLLGHSGDALLQLLERAEGPQAAVALLALSRLEFPRGIEVCLARARDSDDGVREAALRSLRRYQSPNIKLSMIRALDDPARAVRVEALRYLSVYRDASVLDELGIRVRDEHFSERDEDEVKAWLIAYGIIGREKAITLLRDLALGKIKQRGDAEALRKMAVRGLHATRVASAKLALREVAREHPALRGLIQGLMNKR